MLFDIPMPFMWTLLMLFLLALEALTVQLISIWSAIGALVALLMSLAGVSILSQIISFVIVSLFLLVVICPIARRNLQTIQTNTNADRIIGEKAIVTEQIDNQSGMGKIQVAGQTWTAKAADNDVVIPEGSVVQVDKISGVKAVVRPQSHKHTQ